MRVHSSCTYSSPKHININTYVKKKLRILEDMYIITCDEDRIECRDRYYTAIKASDGDPHNAVDEEHYRILRMFL